MLNPKLLLKLAVLGFALGAAISARAQDTGGLRALDVAPTAQANMLSTPPTQVVVVGASGESLVPNNKFLSWDAAVALGRQQYKETHQSVDIAEVARQTRPPQPRWDLKTMTPSCPSGWSVYASLAEEKSGEAAYVHCVRNKQ